MKRLTHSIIYKIMKSCHMLGTIIMLNKVSNKEIIDYVRTLYNSCETALEELGIKNNEEV